MERFTLFSVDADLWERDGLTIDEEDALVLALWRWYRNRPATDQLTTPAKLVYTPLVKRWKATEATHDVRFAAGRKGGLKTQERYRALATAKASSQAPLLKPTSTSTATSTSTSNTSSSKEGDTPLPPMLTPEALLGVDSAETERTQRRKFTPPTESEVADYCWTNSYKVDAAAFCAYYEANGWMVGRNRMKDWRAAVRSWKTRDKAATNNHACLAVGQIHKQESYDVSDFDH